MIKYAVKFTKVEIPNVLESSNIHCLGFFDSREK